MVIKDLRSENSHCVDVEPEYSSKNPNPQGKGTCQTLGILSQAQETLQLPSVHRDSLKRIATDYLHSLVVLSCEFKFKPVPGKTYYMYSHKERLVLSLVSPEDGNTRIYDAYIGEASLKSDFSWSLSGVEPENIPFVFQLNTQFEAQIRDSAPEHQSIRSVLLELNARKQWKFRSDIGYYQNVMNFMLQKVLHLRLKRLSASDHFLSVEERSLLE